MKAWSDWDEFLRRLREDAAFREEVRRQVLTEDLLNLPAVVQAEFARAFGLIADLTEQVRENSRQIASLTERMDRVEAQIQENSRQIAENSRQIASLAEQVRENSRQIASLTERMDRVEAQIQENSRQIAENSRQIASLAEQVRENGRQIAALTERMDRVEGQIATLTEQVRALTKKMDDMDRTLSRHGQFVGVTWEVDAVRALKEVLRKRGVRLRGGFRTYALPMWEVDALAPAEDERGPLWVLLEVAGRLDPGDVWKLARYLEDPDVRAALGEFGVRGRVQAWVYAMRRKVTAKGTPEEAASKCGVGLLDPEEGILVEPAEWVWEDERP
jgi:uncharacterized coiled-coil protein SlyX